MEMPHQPRNTKPIAKLYKIIIKQLMHFVIIQKTIKNIKINFLLLNLFAKTEKELQCFV